MEEDQGHIRNCEVCVAHSGVVGKMQVLVWLAGGGATVVATLLLWNINLLTDIKANLPGKADAADVVMLKQIAIENKTRIDNLERTMLRYIGGDNASVEVRRDNRAGGDIPKGISGH